MSMNLQELANQAESLYIGKLKDRLERDHRNQFVAIEPISGDYFIGKTGSEAATAAENVYPDRLTHVLRIGHEVAVEIGCMPWSEK